MAYDDEPDFGVCLGRVKVLVETEKAILCELEEDSTVAWVPKSQLQFDSVSGIGDVGDLVVSTWFSTKIDWLEQEDK